MKKAGLIMNRIQENLLLNSEEFLQQKKYWLDRLSGYYPSSNLFMKTRAADYGNKRPIKVKFSYPDELSESLIMLSKQSDLSLYLILLMALKCLIYKYTGSNDIIVCSPVYSDYCSEYTVNDVVLIRDEIREEKTLRECILDTGKSALKAYENQDYPFKNILNIFDDFQEMNPFRNINVMCMLNNIHRQIDIENTDYGLVFAFDRNGRTVELELSCTDGIFNERMLNQLVSALENVLNNIITDVNITIHDAAVISKEERNYIIHQFNSSSHEYPEECCIYQLFEEQMERTPDNIAIEAGGRYLTYRELNEKANRLARVLREKGVKRDSIVAIMADQSVEFVVAVLGVLKAGGAYLPIDLEYPEERIRYMLEDSGTVIVLKDSEAITALDREQGTLSLESPITVINLTDESIYAGDGGNLEPVNSPDDLAYVIYTSGSTGKPKGVMATHRGLVNYIYWANKVYVKGENVDFPLYSSISFDLTVTSIYTPLISGNKIVIYSGENKVQIIKRIVEEGRVGVVKLTPTHLRLLEDMDLASTGVKRFIVGGEDLKTELARKIYESAQGRIDIYNEYGPTETVVGCMIYKYEYEKDERGSVPIGVPADNVQIYLLDKYMNPVPALVEGEIYISGDGVARGYLNRPELTEERFVENPFIPGKRMYRTGDIARRLMDGNIEFVGRGDSQVKIRGYRIEPGEIENALLKEESVKECVVVMKQESETEGYLCAYITSDGEPEENEIKRRLEKELPVYMVPSYIVKVERIPMTTNGKVDAKALPDPKKGRGMKEEYIGPRDRIEEKLAEIWLQVLNLERVGIEDDFFGLGGHSLKAIFLVNRIHKEFNVEVPLGRLFETPTIAGLAEYIRDAEENIYVTIEPVEEKEYYPASSAQRGIYIHNKFEGADKSYNIPLVRIIEGDFDRVRFDKAIEGMIERHEIFRTSFDIVDDDIVQIIHKKIDVEIMYREVTEEEVDSIVENFNELFDLNRVPLFRVGLLKISDYRHVFMLSMHHITTDGESWKIIEKEFLDLYKGIELPKLRIQYKDFAVWQNNLFLTDMFRRQEEYWLSKFSKPVPELNLPIDYKRPVVQSFTGDSITHQIDYDLIKEICKINSQTKTTTYMLFLAVYNILLNKYTKREDIVVITPVAGRTHADLNNLIGMFVNMLPMRNYPQPDKTFLEFLEEVKTEVLKVFENQDYQYEDLVDKCGLRRDGAMNPLFETCLTVEKFDLQVEADAELVDELSVKSYPVLNKTTKFDLFLQFLEYSWGTLLNLEYKVTLFSRSTAEKILQHYIEILHQIVANTNVKIEDIKITIDTAKTLEVVIDEGDFNF